VLVLKVLLISLGVWHLALKTGKTLLAHISLHGNGETLGLDDNFGQFRATFFF
jgi:hypothetical protein